MSEMVLLGRRQLTRREARLLKRELAAQQAERRLEEAAIDTEAQLQACRVQAVKFVASEGLRAVAQVSLQGEQLAQAIPSAAGRLQAIADSLAVDVLGLVSDTARRVS